MLIPSSVSKLVWHPVNVLSCALCYLLVGCGNETNQATDIHKFESQKGLSGLSFGSVALLQKGEMGVVSP